MAGEAGSRHWWRFVHGVNVVNGNLHLVLGSGSCVTCGGSGGGTNVYPNPQNTKLTGPVLIHNSLGAADTDLGTKWMLPYHASLTTDGSGNVTIIDADGTQRVFTKDATSTPQTYTANKEDAVLIGTPSKTVEVCSRAPFLPAPGERVGDRG